jgi:hypothetical protein
MENSELLTKTSSQYHGDLPDPLASVPSHFRPKVVRSDEINESPNDIGSLKTAQKTEMSMDLYPD